MSDTDAAASDVRLRAVVGLELDLENRIETVVMPEMEAQLVALYEHE